jgi:hypothetical protein
MWSQAFWLRANRRSFLLLTIRHALDRLFLILRSPDRELLRGREVTGSDSRRIGVKVHQPKRRAQLL